MRLLARRPATIVGVILLAAAALAGGAPSGCASGTQPCQFNSDCPFGYCMNGSCQQNCVDAARDCPPGYSCDQNAQCVPGSGGAGAGTGGTGTSTSTGGTSSASTGGASTSTGSASTSTSTSTSASSTSASSTSASSTSASSTSGGPMNEHELDPCTSDGDCASPLVCRPMAPGGIQRCTRTCTATATCMAGTVCKTAQGSEYCAADDVGGKCTAAADCNFGCLTGPGYCTVACQTGSDCPNGYGCMAVSGTRVCAKAEAACSTSNASACIVPAACDTSILVSGCTTVCSSPTDCPQRAAGLSPWTCASGICRRPPDVYGPLPTGARPAQYACNAKGATVNVCNDAQHIDFTVFDIPNPPAVSCSASTTTSGIATDSCVDSCRYQGSCPYGSACVAVGTVDGGATRIGLCIPTGLGEVGSPCASDTDCVFGYCPTSLGKCSRDCTSDGVCPGGTSCVAVSGPMVGGQTFRQCQ